MNIDGIENGIIIDHIPSGLAMKVYDLLGLNNLDCCVAIIKNTRSSKYGSKDIIKISEVFDVDLALLGYLSPDITVNIISDGELIGKSKLELPERLVNVVKCKNPRCITLAESDVDYEFKLIDRKKKLYRCIYCEADTEGNK